MKFSLFSLAAVVPLAAAHFHLEYPISRGFDESIMPEFPCGGLSPSADRTQLPLDGSFPVALSMGHIQTAVEVLIAFGSNPGNNYDTVLVPTFQVNGLGAFCLPHVGISDLNITNGMNATVQVQSDGDINGGLYACADVQFSSSVTYNKPSSCKNNTNVIASAFPSAAAQRNANESTSGGQAQSGSGSTTSTGAAVPLQTAAWGILGVALAGGLAVL